jgi:shikimate dehydrogenase
MNDSVPSPSPPRRFYFIGVTTGHSSMRRIFPRWCAELGLNAEFVGVDLPLDTPEARYRGVLEGIRDDPLAAGALVTTHKLNVLRAGRDLFTALDDDAKRLSEVASIVRRPEGTLAGSAKDAMTSILSLRHIVPDTYWGESGAEVLCIGVGGSGQAFALGLLTRLSPEHLPRRITLAARNERRLEQARSVLSPLAESRRIRYALAPSPHETDELLGRLPDGSLVANATGMGKDVPGSPLSEGAVFPRKGIAWDFNYRGDLTFLKQAERQRDSRGVTAHDGWVYFLYGWMHVMADVFGFEVTPELFDRLGRIAETYR